MNMKNIRDIAPVNNLKILLIRDVYRRKISITEHVNGIKHPQRGR